MRPLRELINDNEPAWSLVDQWIDQAVVHVEVLPTNRADGEAALLATQVTTRSPMGAIVYMTAGLLLDFGWLRILGAGQHSRFQRSLPAWNHGRSHGYYLVADDAVGGFFALNGGTLGEEIGKIYYYAPDSLRWEECRLGYSEFLVWAMTARLGDFYESLRWEGWQTEVSKLTGDQTINICPPLFTKGPPVNERSRRAVPVADQYALQFDIQRQLDGQDQTPA
jgi:hypothetical protein